MSGGDPGTDRPTGRRSGGPRAFVMMLLLDVVGPLAVFYGLRAGGASLYLALVLSALVPLVRIVVTLVVDRRLALVAVFSLTLLGVGTVVGLMTADPRLLVVRESYLTAVAGLWILASAVTSRPLVYAATLPFLDGPTAARWREAWRTDRTFRRVFRTMTAAWGAAFLLDAAARVVMAYTLPLDLVPVLGAALLVALLAGIVAGSRAYGRRHLTVG